LSGDKLSGLVGWLLAQFLRQSRHEFRQRLRPIMINTPETPDTPSASPDARSVDPTRRKLAGLGVATIFTLASRPVLAVECNSPSAAASGNLSFHGTPPNCTGRSPSTWVSSVDSSSPNNPNNGFPGGNVEFNNVFANGNGIDWPNGANGRLYEVMNSSSNPDNANTNPRPNPISAEFAATLLNIRGGHIPAEILTEVKLINMWNEWRNTGGFHPTAGMTWNDTQIVNYLRSLQGF
jgi:hypothetical protein